MQSAKTCNLPVWKIISGGQTGADEGGLEAGLLLGLKTGGWMPKGWRRLGGRRPDFEKLYGMREHPSWQYPPRTFANVKESDGTIRFATNFSSPGECCTMKAIRKYQKPHFDVNLRYAPTYQECQTWLLENNIRVLNVAGNAEETSPGIFRFVVVYLAKVLT